MRMNDKLKWSILLFLICIIGLSFNKRYENFDLFSLEEIVNEKIPSCEELPKNVIEAPGLCEHDEEICLGWDGKSDKNPGKIAVCSRCIEARGKWYNTNTNCMWKKK
jgi:hypothetical protein